jgi:hypothetical protein
MSAFGGKADIDQPRLVTPLESPLVALSAFTEVSRCIPLMWLSPALSAGVANNIKELRHIRRTLRR